MRGGAEWNIPYDVIAAFSKEWWDLWKDSCLRFIKKMESLAGDKPVILVKTYLSEKKFDDETEAFFEDIDEIRAINMELEKCYAYFKKHHKKAIVVEVKQLEAYKTAKNFRHGCYPWHLSDFAYGEIAYYIESEVKRNNV